MTLPVYQTVAEKSRADQAARAQGLMSSICWIRPDPTTTRVFWIRPMPPSTVAVVPLSTYQSSRAEPYRLTRSLGVPVEAPLKESIDWPFRAVRLGPGRGGMAESVAGAYSSAKSWRSNRVRERDQLRLREYPRLLGT